MCKPSSGAERHPATALFLPVVLALEKNGLSRLHKCVILTLDRKH